MPTYSLNLTIAEDQLRDLKGYPGYRLCLAMKVNGQYTVVWSTIPSSECLPSNKFQWTDEYQTFSTNTFVVSACILLKLHS